MNKRFAIAILVLLGALAALLLFNSLFHTEPMYRGRKLTAWFKQYYRTGQWSRSSDEPLHEQAARAMRAMGTNAIPFLVAECFTDNRESPFQTNALTFLATLPRPFRFPPFVPAMAVQEQAASAIGEIKPPATLLLALVTNRLNAPDKFQRGMATYLLGKIGDGGEAAVPFLLEKLRSADAQEILLATLGLECLGPMAESALPDMTEFVGTNNLSSSANRHVCRALARIGPAASNAIPVLRQRLANETNYPFYVYLATALICIDNQQAEAMGVLQAELADGEKTNTHAEVICALKDIGANAKSALPLLLAALNTPDAFVWQQALSVISSVGETNLAISKAIGKLNQGDAATRFNAMKFLLRVQPTNAAAMSNLVVEVNELNWPNSAIDEAARLGSLAQPVIPRLREIAASKTNPFREAARKALADIEALVAEEREAR